MSELGLTKLTYFATSELNTAEKENYSHIYVKEIIGLFNLVMFVLIEPTQPLGTLLQASGGLHRIEVALGLHTLQHQVRMAAPKFIF